MKNIITLIIVAFAFTAIAQESIPEYTTIDKLYKISPGMTEKEVTEIIGIPPYDLYHDVANNCKVLVWYYRHKQHSIPSSHEDTRESLNGGKVTYVNTEKVYMTFSENDKKLINYFTDQGKERSVSLIAAGRELQEICNNPAGIKIKDKSNDKTIIRSLNHHRYGAFFKLGLGANPEGKSDLLIGGQYRYIFKPFNNQKSISYEAKLLYNLSGYEEVGDGVDATHEDHLMLSIPMYVSYNWRSWSVGAGLHLGFGNEDSGNDDSNADSETFMGEKKGYDNFLSVPVVKLGYNLYDKVNFEYNYDLSGNGQGSIGVGYYWNF
ncbi:MAG: hypothetical protein H8E84_03525 [Flavobacteriales bacterium]|nr:hypothetical protein [Flavobacteriales bacterium]